MKVVALVGGISSGSINRKLFSAVQAMVPGGTELEAFEITKLPFFSQDLEESPPEEVKELRRRIREADAILFVTPEYNRSFPGVLKNAIDWGSRPYGQNSFDGIPAAVMGASIGNIGTFGAQHHLRQVLAYLNMPTMGQPEFYLNASNAFNDDGALVDQNTKNHIEKFWAAFSGWAEEINAARKSGSGEDERRRSA